MSLSNETWTYTLEDGESITIEEAFGVKKLSVFVPSSSGGTATVKGTAKIGNLPSKDVVIAVGDGVTITGTDISSTVYGIVITAGAGALVNLIGVK